MEQLTLAEAIRVADAEMLVTIADTPDLVFEAHRLRHQVYCLERGYEPGVGNLEIDAFDRHSKHVVLLKRHSNEVFGTARIVLATTQRPARRFPMHEVCGPDTFRSLPMHATAEVSRFAISKERRGLSMETTSLARLALVKGLVQLSAEQGITHWCAMMERTLLRLLRASSIHFTPMGPAIEYHGLRQPAQCEIAAMLARMGDEQPDLWRYITANGRYGAAWMPQLQAA